MIPNFHKMKNYIYLTKISEERSIAIFPANDNDILDSESFIHYRNIGDNFDIKIMNERLAEVKNNEILIYDQTGKVEIHFPLLLISTETNMINYLLNLLGEEMIDIVIDVFGITKVNAKLLAHKKLDTIV